MRAGARSVGAEIDLLVIAPDGQDIVAAQEGNGLVAEAVFVDAVAKAEETVRVAHQPQGFSERARIAVNVRYDPKLHVSSR